MREAAARAAEDVLMEASPIRMSTTGFKAFMADARWSAIKRVAQAKHGSMAGNVQDHLLTPVDDSPACGRGPPPSTRRAGGHIADISDRASRGFS
ncbi:hypothetical protein SSBR45G_29960 [Bradyrhizobium sp. SSBR45G]|uniref:hypothetical protein n=1 Tax=unclassified Bradyrhizobium TaxID=2631580 RepID=UPI002342A1E1|nr:MULTISPECIES: hypothetical protein [unclassified Bradyrhizobium]GLH78088.1 hypothetical protein SSBR45G_29960 [Bradyrhizobium sp. SSBR45G]GLH87986.1 hypothetical protein SSBR45R_54460 [Bradyrhizobium sp. SSBR45R]